MNCSVSDGHYLQTAVLVRARVEELLQQRSPTDVKQRLEVFVRRRRATEHAHHRAARHARALKSENTADNENRINVM